MVPVLLLFDESSQNHTTSSIRVIAKIHEVWYTFDLVRENLRLQRKFYLSSDSRYTLDQFELLVSNKRKRRRKKYGSQSGIKNLLIIKLIPTLPQVH